MPGKLLTDVVIPSNASGSALTYLDHGTQYIGLAVGGGNIPAELIDTARPLFILANRDRCYFRGHQHIAWNFLAARKQVGAGSSIVVAFGVNFAGYSWTHRRLDSWEPNIFLVALLAGIVTAIGVSLITAPEPKGATDDFYRNLNTSSDPSPQGLPAGHSVDEKSLAESGRQLIFVNFFHLQQGARGVGFFRAYRVDLLSFSFGWIIAFLLIIGVFLLFRF